MDIYSNAIENRDISKIQKLNQINSLDGFWDEVRKHTKNVYSDHSLNRWQILAETRETELREAANAMRNQLQDQIPECYTDKYDMTNDRRLLENMVRSSFQISDRIANFNGDMVELKPLHEEKGNKNLTFAIGNNYKEFVENFINAAARSPYEIPREELNRIINTISSNVVMLNEEPVITRQERLSDLNESMKRDCSLDARTVLAKEAQTIQKELKEIDALRSGKEKEQNISRDKSGRDEI